MAFRPPHTTVGIRRCSFTKGAREPGEVRCGRERNGMGTGERRRQRYPKGSIGVTAVPTPDQPHTFPLLGQGRPGVQVHALLLAVAFAALLTPCASQCVGTTITSVFPR